MKLVEILARELKVWPDDGGPVAAIVQDPDRMAFVRAADDSYDFEFIGGEWVGVWHNQATQRPLSELATDYSTAIVTRADWEAERAKLKSPKANGDGWVRHRGGKRPVDGGVRVDVRYRDGDIEMVKAGDMRWNHGLGGGDIMAYRIHKPAEQSSGFNRGAIEESVRLARIKEDGWVEDTQAAVAVLSSPSAPTDTMLAIRDRIRELDTHRAEVESTYQRQVSEITQERESLVQRLAGEGLALAVVQPVEDMSDPVSWRKGDFVECAKPTDSNGITVGKVYELTYVTRDCIGFLDDDGDHRDRGDVDKFKWHSRPAT